MRDGNQRSEHNLLKNHCKIKCHLEGIFNSIMLQSIVNLTRLVLEFCLRKVGTIMVLYMNYFNYKLQLVDSLSTLILYCM